MNKEEIIQKITEKKEFSQLRKIDIQKAFEKFDKQDYSDEEKIKLTRDLLRKVFSVFTSRKLLVLKDREQEWILKKHVSTKERFPFYDEIYKRILKNSGKETSIFDFGAGVNGFSYKYFGRKINYIGIEAIGQLVDLTNNFFQKNKIKNTKTIHLSLFEIEELKKLLKETKGEKIVFLFKTLDSLEMLERDYSKKLINEIIPLTDKIVVSFATRSLIKHKKFLVSRKWFFDFIKENFKIIDDFETGYEQYIIFQKK